MVGGGGGGFDKELFRIDTAQKPPGRPKTRPEMGKRLHNLIDLTRQLR